MDPSTSFECSNHVYRSSGDCQGKHVISLFTLPRCSLPRGEEIISYCTPKHDQCAPQPSTAVTVDASVHRDCAPANPRTSCSSGPVRKSSQSTASTVRHKSTHKGHSIDPSRKKKFTRALSSSLTSSTSSSSSSSSSSDAHPTPAFLLRCARETSRLKEKNNFAIRTQLSQ